MGQGWDRAGRVGPWGARTPGAGGPAWRPAGGRALALAAAMVWAAGCGPSSPPDEGTPAPTASAAALTPTDPAALSPSPTSTSPASGRTPTPQGPTPTTQGPEPTPAATAPARTPLPAGALANVLAVNVTGQEGAYTFAVTVKSPDTGCEHYADWWEVVSPDGSLIYRRILDHSHVDDQPFTRSGGPVAVSAQDELIVRAHMNEDGYGGRAERGTPSSRFEGDDSVGPEWHPELGSAAPLPESCAF